MFPLNKAQCFKIFSEMIWPRYLHFYLISSLRNSSISLLQYRKYICNVVKRIFGDTKKNSITKRFFQLNITAMKNPSIESELMGTLKVLDTHQKTNVLSFIREQLKSSPKKIAKQKALRDIKIALNGGYLAF